MMKMPKSMAALLESVKARLPQLGLAPVDTGLPLRREFPSQRAWRRAMEARPHGMTERQRARRKKRRQMAKASRRRNRAA